MVAARGALAAALLAACSTGCAAYALREQKRVGLGSVAWAEPDEDADADAEPSQEPFDGGAVEGEVDSHVYKFEQEQNVSRQRRRQGHTEVPRGGRVAVVLRGASFRGRKAKTISCMGGTATLRRQLSATQSLVDYVIKPFEAAGNQVDVFVTDRVCQLTDQVIVPAIGKQRVKISVQSNEGDQRVNIEFALDEMAKFAGGLEQAQTMYSHILVVRHDTHWLKPINEWPDADFSKVLFPYKCPTIGVHDLFTMMPAGYLHFYRTTMKNKKCFAGADGHLCMQAMAALTNESSVDVAMRYGGKDGRQPFDFWYTYGKPRETC